MSLLFFLFSSAAKSTNLITSSDLREIWTCTQPSYGPEPNLDVYAVLSYDPVKFGQECGRANLTLAFCSNPTSVHFKVNFRTLSIAKSELN